MANTCTNMFFATIKTENAEPKHEEIYKQIHQFLDDNVIVVNDEIGNCFIEVDFDSKWTFPYDDMEKLTEQLKEQYPCEYKDLYIRCLSYEFGCEYVDYMIFSNGQWYSKIALED